MKEQCAVYLSKPAGLKYIKESKNSKNTDFFSVKGSEEDETRKSCDVSVQCALWFMRHFSSRFSVWYWQILIVSIYHFERIWFQTTVLRSGGGVTRVRFLATVRGEIGHPLGVTVLKWVGFHGWSPLKPVSSRKKSTLYIKELTYPNLTTTCPNLSSS